MQTLLHTVQWGKEGQPFGFPNQYIWKSYLFVPATAHSSKGYKRPNFRPNSWVLYEIESCNVILKQLIYTHTLTKTHPKLNPSQVGSMFTPPANTDAAEPRRQCSSEGWVLPRLWADMMTFWRLEGMMTVGDGWMISSARHWQSSHFHLINSFYFNNIF